MIIDSLTEFLNATPLNTGAPGNFVLGDQIDLQVPRNLGGDQALYLTLGVTTGIAAGAAGTVQFALISADNAALTTNPVVHAMTGTFVTGTTSGNAGQPLAAGRRLAVIQVPDEGDVPYKRFVGIRQITGGVAVTAGAVDAFLAENANAWKPYNAPFQTL
jgi:hypothetical protein